MNSKKTSVLCGAAGLILLVFIDQISKYFALNYLAGTSGITLIPGVFELYYLENRGAAFGMFKNQQWFFILIALVMAALACYVYCKLPVKPFYRSMRLVCLLIASGAMGNMIDRIFHNFVIDFLYFSLIDFPVFNIADCYVCVGAALAVILIFTIYKDEEFAFLSPTPKCRTKEENNL